MKIKLINIFFIIGFLLILIYPIKYFIEQQNETLSHRVFEHPKLRNVSDYIIASGTIMPKEKVKIKPNISGIIDSVYVSIGEIVEVGDIIAEIKVIPNQIELTRSESKINNIRVKLKLAKNKYLRNKILFEKGIIAKANYEEYENDYYAIKQSLNNTTKEYNITKSGKAKNSHNISTQVLSTITGTVTQIFVEKGSSVIERNNFNEGTSIVKVADLNTMIFNGKIKEYEIKDVNKGMSVEITISYDKDNVLLGKIDEISTEGENSDGVVFFWVKSKIKNFKLKKTGLSANMKIITNRRENILTISERALYTNNDSLFVYLIKDEKIIKRNIDIGITDGIFTQVISGLNQQDKVLLDGK